MKALVIGAPGLVGKALVRSLQARGADVLGTYRSRPHDGMVALDVTDPVAVRAVIQRYRPTVVFLTAALTAVDYCEDHREEAWRINVDGPAAVAGESGRVGAKLLFYSTEYVFDGVAGPYSEDDPPHPLGAYAQSKAAGEEAIRAALDDHLILRTTVVFGWDPTSLNFAMQVWKRLSAGETMRVPSDQWSTPTLAEFLADASVRLVERETRGVVNVVGRDRVPRTEFAVRLARRLGLDPALIEPVTTAELNQVAPRPLNAGLRTDRVAELLGELPMGLDEAIENFVGRKGGQEPPTAR